MVKRNLNIDPMFDHLRAHGGVLVEATCKNCGARLEVVYPTPAEGALRIYADRMVAKHRSAICKSKGLKVAQRLNAETRKRPMKLYLSDKDSSPLLTESEQKVLFMLNLPTKEIAAALGRSKASINGSWGGIKSKTKIRTREEAMLIAFGWRS